MTSGGTAPYRDRQDTTSPARSACLPSPGEARSKQQLDVLAEQATVDCYNDEQLTGLYTMIADNPATPLSTRVLDIEVTVENVDLRDRYDIVANCSRGKLRRASPSWTCRCRPRHRTAQSGSTPTVIGPPEPGPTS